MKIKIKQADTVCYDCRYLGKSQKECAILKKLYCKIEPDKKCSWYKQKESEDEGNDR